MAHTSILDPGSHLIGEIVIDYKRVTQPTRRVRSSEEAYKAFLPLFNRPRYKEEFYLIPVDKQSYMLGWVKISEGGLYSTTVDMKMVFQPLLLTHSSGFFCAHNHPSGHLEPSTRDINQTRDLEKAGKILDILLIDHLVISPEDYFSFKDEGFFRKH